jgi:hypothetical protein
MEFLGEAFPIPALLLQMSAVLGAPHQSRGVARRRAKSE